MGNMSRRQVFHQLEACFRLSQNFHKCYHGNKESMNLYIFSIELQLNNQTKINTREYFFQAKWTISSLFLFVCRDQNNYNQTSHK